MRISSLQSREQSEQRGESSGEGRGKQETLDVFVQQQPTLPTFPATSAHIEADVQVISGTLLLPSTHMNKPWLLRRSCMVLNGSADPGAAHDRLFNSGFQLHQCFSTRFIFSVDCRSAKMAAPQSRLVFSLMVPNQYSPKFFYLQFLVTESLSGRVWGKMTIHIEEACRKCCS